MLHKRRGTNPKSEDPNAKEETDVEIYDAYESHDTDSLLSNLNSEEEEESDGDNNFICKAGSSICKCCPCIGGGSNKVGASKEPEEKH